MNKIKNREEKMKRQMSVNLKLRQRKRQDWKKMDHIKIQMKIKELNESQ